MILTARHALLPSGLAIDVTVELDGATITAVRPWRPSDPSPSRGLLLPGLVNAHTHLELSWSGLVPGGEGLPRWVQRLVAKPRPSPAPPPDLRSLRESGAALVCDISNGGETAEVLLAAGMQGVVQHERLGMAPARLPGLLQAASAPDRDLGRVYVRPSPHAVYSTPPALIRATARPGRHPASIHLAEDPAEEAFLRDGTGGFREMLDAMGIDLSAFSPPKCSPARYLDELAVLGPGLLCVHGVHLSRDDMALLAARTAPLALCPRSNLHIGGRLPDVPALLGAGVELCLGTDSLASSPSLDVLAEIPILARAYPEIPLERWLSMATRSGACALGFPALGQITAGAAPGLVLLHVDAPMDLTDAVPERVILASN